MKRKFTSKYYRTGNYHDYLQRKFDCLASDLIEEVGLKRENSILDYGCGYGGLIWSFWNLGFRNIWGTDLSKWAIDWGKEKYPLLADRLHYYNQNILTERYRCIFILDVLEHIPEYEIHDLLSIINRRNRIVVVRIPVSLSENGMFVLPQSNSDKTHITAHTKRWWVKIFKRSGFNLDGEIYRSSIFSSAGVFCGKLKRSQ